MSAQLRPLPSPVRGASLTDALALTAADRQAVDALIRDRLRSDVLLVNQVAEHIVAGGGKRLRPLVVLLAARAAGYRDGTQHHLAAAIIEFIHTATLLHDDVVDESDLRRGRRTANAVFGNAASVLVGDFLYSRSFQLMVELGRAEVMAVMADTTNRIAEGEVMQLMHVHNPDVDEAAYRRVIERKTAVLFEAAGRLGAILAEAPPATATALARYGRELGFAFQIADDWLDYVADADALGKNLGDDLAEGKATLPLIRALETVAAGEREILRRALADGDVEALPAVRRIVERSGALDHARGAAELHAEAARRALEPLPASPEREALAAIARYAVERDR
jgi:octaprenyl-diphosphate synthase